MKALVLLSSIFYIVNADKLSHEFLKGFETGVVTRTDQKSFDDFSCPKPEPTNQALEIISHWTEPASKVA